MEFCRAEADDRLTTPIVVDGGWVFAELSKVAKAFFKIQCEDNDPSESPGVCWLLQYSKIPGLNSSWTFDHSYDGLRSITLFLLPRR